MLSAISVLPTESNQCTLVHQREYLTPMQHQQLRELVDQFADIFLSTPGLTHLVEHEIKTPLGVVVRQQPYRVPEACRQVIEEEVSHMLQVRIIEESSSWSSPIWVVPKPNGSSCLGDDFGRLNQISESSQGSDLERAQFISP